MKDTEAAAAGVDRGGTWTRLSCVNSRGTELRGTRFPTSKLDLLIARLEKEFKKLKLEAGLPLVIATRGAFSKKWKRDFLFKAARGRLNLLDVISDAEAAHFAAFGGKAGLLLIAGTGAVAFYRDSTDRMVKTGGHNPAGGDPGSGRWIGRQYLKKLKKTLAGLSHGQTAAYAAALIAAAGEKAGWQRELAAHAQNNLAILIAKSLKNFPRTKKIKVALTGGLIKNKFFREGLIKMARERVPSKLIFTALKTTAQTAAAHLALIASTNHSPGARAKKL
ncbi:MAG TPA: hypothetical protein DCL44_05630 [Elusimicrobia bacterium]|nr:hypothetical protein [Elusimicrobiota bacterium]